jgi:hypothetical protein
MTHEPQTGGSGSCSNGIELAKLDVVGAAHPDHEETAMNATDTQGEDIKALQDGGRWMAEQLERADKQVRSFLTEHPVLSLACAVGIGYLAARLLRGSK